MSTAPANAAAITAIDGLHSSNQAAVFVRLVVAPSVCLCVKRSRSDFFPPDSSRTLSLSSAHGMAKSYNLQEGNPAMPRTRREFLTYSSVGILTAALEAASAQTPSQEPTPGAPPAFG